MLIDRHRSPLASRRAYRLGLGVGLATAIAYGLGLPMAFLVILLTAVLLSNPAPPPNVKAALLLIVVMLVTCAWGLLLGPVLAHVSVAGVLLMLLGVGIASYLATDPTNALIASLLVLGSTTIAVVARQSSAAAVILVQLMVGSIVAAIVISHLCHLLFPEDGPVQRPLAAPPAAGVAGWIAVRAAIIMLPPILLALANPGSYLMLLMKGAALSQQVEQSRGRLMARELVLSTIIGGAAALAVWTLLRLWPGLLLFTLLMGLAALLVARPMFGAVQSRFRFEHWQNVLTTAIILIGPAVTDSATGVDIDRQMMIRLLTFLVLVVYAAAMVELLDGWRARRRVPA